MLKRWVIILITYRTVPVIMHACLRLQSSCECTSCWKLVAINTQLSITLATVVAEDDIVLTVGNKEHDIASMK